MKRFDPTHPFPAVYFKHGAYWHVVRNQWQRIGTTLEEASAEYARRVSKPTDGKLPQMLEKAYGHHLATHKLAANTKAQYRIALDELKRRVRLFNPEQLKAKHVAQIKLDGAAHPNMTNRKVSLLRTLFGYLVEWQLVDSNPCVGVKRYVEAKRKRYLTDAEWWAIYERAGERLQLIMSIQYLTGQRISDVLNLHRRQLTAEGIVFTPTKTANSTGATICVAWTDELKVAVARACEQHGKVRSMWVFATRTRKAPDYETVHRQFTEAATAAGVEDARPNDHRAKAATDAKRQGKNATALLAHSDEQMTKRYLRLFETVLVQGPTMARAS